MCVLIVKIRVDCKILAQKQPKLFINDLLDALTLPQMSYETDLIVNGEPTILQESGTLP